ncbi:MAG: proline--tRNA ligase [Nanoarchaeota archaeon]
MVKGSDKKDSVKVSKPGDSKSGLGMSHKKNEDFSEWYPEVVQKAELADYSPVKGFMVIRPNAYYIWQKVQDYFNERLKVLGVRNAYFPLLIPESFFKKESEHAQGFSPEVAWIAKEKGDDSERLAIRPTSETIMYDSYSKWVRSYRDLPLRINQWANVVRWETKTTRLFLRTREFLWQEGHCVYETKEECDNETLMYLSEYANICKELLALPVIQGIKSEKEKFAGALYTTTIEGIMPDGKSLQCGTSHNLGQGFAKSFGISPLGRQGENILPWQNSWGISTRLIGATVMTHSDDKGLVLPPRVAYNKVVVVPIYNESNRNVVLKEAKKVVDELSELNPILDDRDSYSPGFKFSDWELKGIPLRIEIGPKDIEKKSVVMVKRNNGEKVIVKATEVKKQANKILNDIHDELYKNAMKFLHSKFKDSNNSKDVIKFVDEGFTVLSALCGRKECEEEMRTKADGIKVLMSPIEQTRESLKNKKCTFCTTAAKDWSYIGKSY